MASVHPEAFPLMEKQLWIIKEIANSFIEFKKTPISPKLADNSEKTVQVICTLMLQPLFYEPTTAEENSNIVKSF